MRKYGVLLIMLLLIISLLTGCFKGEQTFEEIDIPEEITLLEEEEQVDDNNTVDEVEIVESEEKVLREIYLLDVDGMVVPQQLELPKTKSAAMQVLEYMVKDGPVTGLLPNGFEAVLPANTEIISLNLQEDGTLIVDLSEEFKNYEAAQELKILQAMTHSLTQFDSIDRIKLRINGEDQTEMPVNGTPLSDGYSVKNGINIFIEEKPNVATSEPLTIYHPKQYNNHYYYVPTTQYFDSKDGDIFSSIVETLIEGPAYEIRTLNVFNDETSLLQKPVLHEGVLQLVFNEAILKDIEKAIIADEVVETLVKSLTAVEEVEAVNLKVENKAVLTNEKGTTYDRPVTRSDFEMTEKM